MSLPRLDHSLLKEKYDQCLRTNDFAKNDLRNIFLKSFNTAFLTSGNGRSATSLAVGSLAVGALAVGLLAVGSLAVGLLAVGSPAVGSPAVGSSSST